jgi:hypothetical protein
MRERVADTMAVQKYDIPKLEAEGQGFEERYGVRSTPPSSTAGKR